MLNSKKLGESGVEISEIILGCWVMGGEAWGGADDKESIAAIHAAMDVGMYTLDTAEAYNNGYSESIIGQAIEGRPYDVVISSKVRDSHLAYDDVIAACEHSLQRLRRDYIDIYFLHWPAGYFSSKFAPLEETMRAMAELKRAGKIRAIGLSNFTKEHFETARAVARVDAYQPPFNMLWRKVEAEMLPYCAANNIAVVPYSTIGQGILSGKFNIGHVFKEGDSRPKTPLFQPENLGRANELLAKIKPIAEKYDKTLAQLSLRWIMQVPGITAPLCGGRTPEQVKENAGGAGWALAQEDYDFIDALSREYSSSLPNYKNYFNTEIIN